jgi:hypothetical protein
MEEPTRMSRRLAYWFSPSRFDGLNDTLSLSRIGAVPDRI